MRGATFNQASDMLSSKVEDLLKGLGQTVDINTIFHRVIVNTGSIFAGGTLRKLEPL
jgi:hypothetical protein